MGAVGLIGIVAGAVLAATMKPPTGQSDDMQPNGIDSFKVNQNSEGQVVPMVWGKVRLTTNILWYGNLVSEPITEKVGGKGAKKQRQTTGFKYYMDIWHGLCMGPNVTINSIYVQDQPKATSELGTYTLNSGDDGTYPTEPGAYASPMEGMAHLFLDGYYLGTNTNQIPTIHLEVTRTSDAPLTYVNETNGVNPAAVIYDILLASGVLGGDIDLTSFNAASEYWHDKGYGLNITLNRQAETRDHINKIFTYVDGSLRVDENDRFVLTAHADSDTSSATIDTEDFSKFQFKRRAWDDVYCDFRANFIDEDADYTTRTIRVRNPAVRELIGHSRQKSLDLSAFRDADTASKRLWEIMKKWSYPEAQIKCTVGIEYSTLNVGDIVTINHDDYNISSADFRVMGKDESELSSNKVQFTLIQYLEGLMDSNYSQAGGTEWTTPTYTPLPLAYERVIELPYSETYKESPSFLCLGARAGQEDGFIIMFSPDGSDYTAHDLSESFAQYGTLGEEYTANTEAIDDDIGILFTPYRDDPSFDDLSRANLFSTLRTGVLYNTSDGSYELFGFQTITPVGSSSYRITGIIRGLSNTDKQTWATGTTEVWLTNFSDNVATALTAGDFYLKLVPFSGDEEVSLASCAAINVTASNVAATPWPPASIKVTRTGTSNAVVVTPTPRLFLGAGTRDGATQADQDPPEFAGSFQWYTSATATITTESSNSFTVTQGGTFTLYVRHQVSGLWSGWKSIIVSAADATYYGPEA